MYKHTVVVGLQHGDEAKSRTIDNLIQSENFKHVVRFNGGPNAGHTIWTDGKKFVLHGIPSGIITPGVQCYIGPGCVINVAELVKEIEELEAAGIPNVRERLHIDRTCNFIFPWHVDEDIQSEGRSPVGSTKKGIAPCYADKYGRRGKNFLTSPIQGSAIKECFKDVGEMLRTVSKNGESILFEGAQGAELDVDSPSYPYVTSSHCTAAFAAIGSGMGLIRDLRVVGVCKPYLTKVGGGPFPTSIEGTPTAELIRDIGREWGATTGRPRKIGWLNLDELKRSIAINGVTELALLKNDVLGLSGLTAVGVYENGEVNDVNCWTSRDDASFEHFLVMLEQKLDVPIVYIGYGADRNDLTIRR